MIEWFVPDWCSHRTRPFSGKRWAASAQIALPQGDQRILLETRGTRRLSYRQRRFDLRLSRPISFGGATRVDLFVDVLNALNDTAEEGLPTDNLYSPISVSSGSCNSQSSQSHSFQSMPNPTNSAN